MHQFRSVEETAKALGAHLRKVHRPYEGAQFRIAFVREEGSLYFLTGRAYFAPHHLPSRPRADYGRLVFIDYWCREQDAALKFLVDLLSGRGAIDGEAFNCTFTDSRFEHHPYQRVGEQWSGWCLTSSRDRDAGYRDIYLDQGPLLAFGERPYLGPSQAISDWLFDLDPSGNYGASVPSQNEIVTLFPDTRARVVTAAWSPGKLSLDLELNVPADQVQLQIVQTGSSTPYQIVPAAAGISEVEVPDDTRQIAVYLVDSSGSCITQASLFSLYEGVAEGKATVSTGDRALADLGMGESETVEYKPFLVPNNEKESEFVKSVIAFANTAGGRIYVGVNDDGSPQEDVELRKAFNEASAQALKSQMVRLRWLITNRIKPTPSYKVEEAAPFGHPVAVATIERGTATPYSTHDNQVFVRKGATNRRPDASELKGLAGGTGFAFGATR